jgi:hypothetical protein
LDEAPAEAGEPTKPVADEEPAAEAEPTSIRSTSSISSSTSSTITAGDEVSCRRGEKGGEPE